MCTFLLLAGGQGTRMQNVTPKQFLLLAGKPIIMHTLEKIEKIDKIKKIVIVCKEEYREKIENYRKDYRLKKEIRYANAGSTRQQSVYNGLGLVKTDTVIIHEAARPFVNKREFENIIECKEKNVTYTYSIPYTVLKIKEDCIDELLDRDELVNIQLPQKFETSVLIEAHRNAIKDNKFFTEDASLVKYYSDKKVKILKGTQYNLKITEPLDLVLGEIIYKENLMRKE